MSRIEVPVDFGDKLRNHTEHMDVLSRANAIPLPGPTADAFAIAPSIDVGPYKVRPFYDADFEFLQELDHPLFEMMVKAQDGKAVTDGPIPKRSKVWELYYIFTHDVEEIDDLMSQGKSGIALLRADAKKAFSKLQGNAIMAIDAAIGEQLKKYWAPAIAYEADNPEQGEATSKVNFTPATVENPLTASAG